MCPGLRVGWTMEPDPATDLPLHANVDNVRVKHYLIRIALSDSALKNNTSTIEGDIIAFFVSTEEKDRDEDQLSSSKRQKRDDNIILDCKDIDVSSCSVVMGCSSQDFEAFVGSFSERAKRKEMNKWYELPCEDVGFKVTPWYLDICCEGRLFPLVLRIRYRTTPRGGSLAWRRDYSGSPCVFTCPSNINNRALFPCQEPPVAMATWQAAITAPADFEVLCSGDEDAEVDTSTSAEDPRTHYFYSSMVLPMSTFSLAIGKWKCVQLVSRGECESLHPNSETPHLAAAASAPECSHEPYPCHVRRGDSGPLIPCRLFAPQKFIEDHVDVKSLSVYVSGCLEAAYSVIGSHPFAKLDFLVPPRCFSSLGFASPNLTFLSQSLFLRRGDLSMMPRIAHEVSHSWFGLVIGAMDWTEEWLSEGFATFMEDPIHEKAMQVISRRHPTLESLFGCPLQNQPDWNKVAQLRAEIRFRTLSAELENTESDLQSLRPMRGNELRDEKTDTLFVKNGINPEIAFTQVHYIKGYFLLRYLLSLLDEPSAFFEMLRRYVHDLYHGRLVHSTDFLRLYFETFLGTRENMKNIVEKWLNASGMNHELVTHFGTGQIRENPLYREVGEHFQHWKDFNRSKNPPHSTLSVLSPDLIPQQLVLLLEQLLELDSLKSRTLKKLDSIFRLSHSASADVLHRWCELVVKHAYSPGYPCVKWFLREHQAMGIYLYGELALSPKSELKRLGKVVLKSIIDEMDIDLASSARDMTFG